VRNIPNIFAGHMNDGRTNQEDVFKTVCERIGARAPG
jgi:methyltransferase-like protein